jgi:hypothetical protein
MNLLPDSFTGVVTWYDPRTGEWRLESFIGGVTVFQCCEQMYSELLLRHGEAWARIMPEDGTAFALASGPPRERAV